MLHLRGEQPPPPPPSSFAPNAFFLFQILSNSVGHVVLLDLAELFKKGNWSCVFRRIFLALFSLLEMPSSYLILQLLPPLQGQVLQGSEHLWWGAESLSLLLMLWEMGWRGRAQHLPGSNTGDVLGNSLETLYCWKEGCGPSKDTGQGKEYISLAKPYQARSKALSILVKRGVAKRKEVTDKGESVKASSSP